MITPEQLAKVKIKLNSFGVTKGQVLGEALGLVAELERLQELVKVKDAALAQFSDKENWGYEPPQRGPDGRIELRDEWQWLGTDPIDLAQRALNGEG